MCGIVLCFNKCQQQICVQAISVTGVEEQDAVNLRTLQASAISVLGQATTAANTAVGDAITNLVNILNRDIRTKSLNSDPQGTATKNFIYN